MPAGYAGRVSNTITAFKADAPAIYTSVDPQGLHVYVPSKIQAYTSQHIIYGDIMAK